MIFLYLELSTPFGVGNSEGGNFMRRILFVEDFMKHLAAELQKSDDERRLASDDYTAGYNDALEFVLAFLRRYF